MLFLVMLIFNVIMLFYKLKYLSMSYDAVLYCYNYVLCPVLSCYAIL